MQRYAIFRKDEWESHDFTGFVTAENWNDAENDAKSMGIDCVVVEVVATVEKKFVMDKPHWDSAAPAQPAEAEQERFRVGETVEALCNRVDMPPGGLWRSATVYAVHPNANLCYEVFFDGETRVVPMMLTAFEVRRPSAPAPKPLAFGTPVTVAEAKGVVISSGPDFRGWWQVWIEREETWHSFPPEVIAPI